MDFMFHSENHLKQGAIYLYKHAKHITDWWEWPWMTTYELWVLKYSYLFGKTEALQIR